MSTTPIAVKLTTPPTRQKLGGVYGSGGDDPHAREKFVDGIGNLNLAVNQLNAVVGVTDSTEQNVTGLLGLVNGNLSFGNIAAGQHSANMKSTIVQGTSPIIANTAFTLTHNLGQIPNGFIVIRKDQHADFYGDSGTGTWDTSVITIKCDTITVGYTILVIA